MEAVRAHDDVSTFFRAIGKASRDPGTVFIEAYASGTAVNFAGVGHALE